MTDVMRDMIAQLMGSQKEGEEGRDLPPYHHPSVCRAYLIGCCPYELVPDSRLQGLVSCRKTHEPAHKADFLKAQKERDHYYDVDGQTDFRLAGPGSNAARLRVCEDCGAQLNIMDHESRIADHFGGKMHLGMVECREKYAEMKVSFR
ncbi:hypothetical protein ANCCEY_11452, partial [Ancylostoma ceylanicum]